MSETIKDKYFRFMVLLMVVIQPIIELDYLIYDFLDKYNIPRISTIFKFVIMPLIIIYAFVKYDKNKKRSLIVTLIYGISTLIYFVIHCYNSVEIRNDLYLPPNFYFSFFSELIYVITMIMPYYLIYVFYEIKIKDRFVKFAAMILSASIGLPILISNLFVFSYSTYVGWTKNNIFSWFNDEIFEIFEPRQLAGKFFFVEGNTIGIVLFMILPIMYYYLHKAQTKKEKTTFGFLIVVQSLAMLILSTKVATYGAVLCPIIFLVILTFTVIMKNDRFKKMSIVFPLIMVVLMSAILPHTPAVKNLEFDAVNDQAVLDDNYMIEEGKGGVDKELEGAKTKYDPALVYAFEQYGIKSNLMSAVPTSYYMEWYKYTHDAAWWLDLLFNVPFYERVNGRQIQELFIKYKMSEAPNIPVEYALGLGYSTIMNGSLILEKDFVQQFYSFGYVGFVFLLGPWIAILVYGVVKVLKHFKKFAQTDILIYASSLLMGLTCGYVSGHVLDEFPTMVLLALLAGILLVKVNKKGQTDVQD